jgi:hypothetical protein
MNLGFINLVVINFCFVQTQNCWIVAVNKLFHGAFLNLTANAVDIPMVD